MNACALLLPTPSHPDSTKIQSPKTLVSDPLFLYVPPGSDARERHVDPVDPVDPAGGLGEGGGGEGDGESVPPPPPNTQSLPVVPSKVTKLRPHEFEVH